MLAFEIKDLSLKYSGAKRPSLDHISLQIEEGSFFALLGPNGAGKTTLFAVLSGLLDGQCDQINLLGKSATQLLRREYVGLVPQEIALYEQLNAVENLRFFGRLRGLSGSALEKKLAHALESVHLISFADRPVRTFSGGMKRRLNLAVALMHPYKVLLLDEPTVGVDPQSRQLIYKVLKDLNKCGATIVYSTHYMEEVTKLCSHIAIINHGKLLYDQDTQANQDVEAMFLQLTGRELKDE